MHSGTENMWLLPSDLTAAGVARGHIVDTCSGMPAAKVDLARLLVTELVANAVLHGLGTVILVAARDGAGVRVYVVDESPELPVVLEPKSLTEHGMGMRLVAALADNWGAAQREDGQPGKRVWFSLD